MKNHRKRANHRSSSISPTDRGYLKKIGLKIHKDLFEQKKPVEQLAFDSGVARSSIREIIAGRSNPRILTLCAVAKALGYSTLQKFLDAL